jgi:hypothetical protein
LSTDELKQIRLVFQGLQTLYQTYFPAVNPTLIGDLLVRELNKKSEEKSTLPPFYLVEIRTVNGTDQEMMKSMIIAIYMNSYTKLPI